MKIKSIVIHCSATPNGRETSAEDIHRWHLEKGWDGIGYHSVIKLNGEVEAGRPHYWMGSHARSNNLGALGICLIGNDEFTPAQMRSLEGLVLALHAQYPESEIVGHYELNPHKTCPNFDVKAWWLVVKDRSLD